MSYNNPSTMSQTDGVSSYSLQRRQDEDHLRLLSLFSFIFGGLTAFGSTFALVDLFLGFAMLRQPDSALTHAAAPSGPGFPAPMMAWMFICIGGGVTLFGWVLGALTVYSGMCMKKRVKPVFSTVIAAVNCLNIPLGTALGVFTLIVLARPSVKGIYDPRVVLEPASAYRDR